MYAGAPEVMNGKKKMIYNITPCPKPRMTRSDRWKKRPSVLRYFVFKDECRLNRVEIPEYGGHITFIIPMPKSWSKKRRSQMDGKPHRQRPDTDNLLKAICDAVFDEDCTIWDIRATKLWGDVGSIHVTAGNQ